MCLKTPLYDCHVEAEGRIVPFAGYYLPVQYKTGVIAEHNAVRKSCGLFDVSHMGEVVFRGKDALANIQKLVTNDMSGMENGRVRYSPMCYETGGVVDDLLVCKVQDDCYLLVVNASNRHKDVQWMREHLFGDVAMEDISDSVAQLALQGPMAPDILKKLADEAVIPTKYYTFVKRGMVGGIECLISRTGYTGELGYELYCAPSDAAALWHQLLCAGEEYGLIPCGLGARDTLRMEAAMPLYGHEMDVDVTPLEAGLGFFVKMDKPDFIGKQALLEKGEPERVRVGLSMTGKGIAREHCPVYMGDKQIGIVTSGTHCPYLNHAVAMSLIQKECSDIGTRVEVDVRGRRIEAEIVALPFYKRGGK